MHFFVWARCSECSGLIFQCFEVGQTNVCFIKCWSAFWFSFVFISLFLLNAIFSWNLYYIYISLKLKYIRIIISIIFVYNTWIWPGTREMTHVDRIHTRPSTTTALVTTFLYYKLKSKQTRWVILGAKELSKTNNHSKGNCLNIQYTRQLKGQESWQLWIYSEQYVVVKMHTIWFYWRRTSL